MRVRLHNGIFSKAGGIPPTAHALCNWKLTSGAGGSQLNCFLLSEMTTVIGQW